MRVVEVTLAQKEGAQLRIKLLEQDGKPVPDWTRKIAAARPRPEVVEPAVDVSDEVILYLV